MNKEELLQSLLQQTYIPVLIKYRYNKRTSKAKDAYSNNHNTYPSVWSSKACRLYKHGQHNAFAIYRIK